MPLKVAIIENKWRWFPAIHIIKAIMKTFLMGDVACAKRAFWRLSRDTPVALWLEEGSACIYIVCVESLGGGLMLGNERAVAVVCL